MSELMPDFMKTPEFKACYIHGELLKTAPDWLKKAYQKWLDDGQKEMEAADNGSSN